MRVRSSLNEGLTKGALRARNTLGSSNSVAVLSVPSQRDLSINIKYLRKLQRRYPQDIYDRIWDPDQYYLDAVSTSTQSIRLNLNTSAVPDDAPMTVLQSDRFNFYNQSLAYSFPLSQSTGNYLMNAYFGTLLNTTGPTMKVLINGGFLVEILGSPPYSSFESTAVQPATYWWNLTLSPISGAPQINGLELYEIVQLQSTTLQKDGTLHTTPSCRWAC